MRPAIAVFVSLAALAALAPLCLTACGDTAGADSAMGAGQVANAGSLTVKGSDSIVVAPRGSAEIRVLYRDESEHPVTGVAVEFVLEGDAPAVSLSSVDALPGPVTNEQGEASIRLTAGSDSATFRVRANAEGAEPVYVDVEVLESAVRTTEVAARYTGLRMVASRTVSALVGLGCGAALESGMQGEVTDSYAEPDGSLLFELGPGLHYAFVAWGRDRTGALLARGCAELDVPVDAKLKLAPVVIELVDHSMSLAGSYEVTLGLDVAPSAKRARDTVLQGGLTLLSGASSQGADYFLDAIEAALRKALLVADADALAAARVDGSLAASLAASLADVDAGPEPWLSQLGARIEAQGSALFLEAAYGVTSVAGVPMSMTLTGMQARTLEGSAEALDFGKMSLPAASIDAQYDDARAVIAVETLSIQLGLGSYAGRLLTAIDDEAEDGGLLGLLAAASGCEELAAWAADQTVIASACDDGCVRAACSTAIDALHAQARMALVNLDVDHPSIGVRGELVVFDRDEDGIVDEIGAAAFEGSWGQAPAAEQADAVDADFTVTSNLRAP